MKKVHLSGWTRFQTMQTVVLTPSQPSLLSFAANLAAQFDLPLQHFPTTTIPPYLNLTPQHLSLILPDTKPLLIDFINGKVGYRTRQGEGRRQPLGRAIGLKPHYYPFVIDATAGLGRDAYVLSSLACRVQMLERSPVIAALLYDGLQRAYVQFADLAENLTLTYASSHTWLSAQTLVADVVYLDPMYPHRQKSALVKKEMRVFRHLVGDDEDAGTLLELGLCCARQRVVVKRPRHAPTLNARKPNFAIESKNTRYDIYLCRNEL